MWFGAWGVLAAVLFPVASNALPHVGRTGILGYVPANLAQGLLPAWAFRRFQIDPAIPGRRGLMDAVTRVVEAVFAEPEEKEKKMIATPLKDLPNGGSGVEWEPFWEPQGSDPDELSLEEVENREDIGRGERI